MAKLVQTNISSNFFNRQAELLAPDLLGKTLRTNISGQLVAGFITDVQAYTGKGDLDSSPYKKSEKLIFDPGVLYVYSSQGHTMLTFAAPGYKDGECVLVRGLCITEGQRVVIQRGINITARGLIEGPGKVSKAFGITTSSNGHNIFDDNSIQLLDGIKLDLRQITNTRRAHSQSIELLRYRVE